jgi:hypothetical protein
MVADFECCTITEVWQMKAVQFLNYLQCLKLKRELDEIEYKKINSKYA